MNTTMTLYGSLPSPFVRRIRMLLDGIDYRFVEVNILDDDSRAQLKTVSPIKKLPVLVDGNETIFDSHIIYEHLQNKLSLPKLTLAQHNLISAIDAVTDSLVMMLFAGRSGLEVTQDTLLFRLQLQRIPECLNWLEDKANERAFKEWNYATGALIALIEWAKMRELYEFSQWTSLLKVCEQFADKPCVINTAPKI